MEVVPVAHGVGVPLQRSLLVSYLQPRATHSLWMPSESIHEYGEPVHEPVPDSQPGVVSQAPTDPYVEQVYSRVPLQVPAPGVHPSVFPQ